MQLFMAVPMTPSAAVSDFGGRRYHRQICRKNRPMSSIQFIVDTGEQFIGGVVDTGEQLLAVLLTPVIAFFPSVVDTGQK
jgi:hypothetical protein